MSEMRTSKNDDIKNWLNSVNSEEYELNAVENLSISDELASTIAESSSSESGEEFQLGEKTSGPESRNCLQNELTQITAPTFNNVSVSNSTNVVLGNIIKVQGNLSINVIKSGGEREEEKNLLCEDVAQQQKLYRPACLIFPRRRWLAMDPLRECDKLQKPVEFVTIGHTETSSSTDRAKNIGLIRDLQTLHVESRGWNDIIFNFLIGCDGVVYEGRGWDVEGYHTTGYNHNSIGVAFVGNFKHKLPTERALATCRNLIICGVAEGHLAADYKILSQYQIDTSKSTDLALYEEIKTWDHFHDIKNNES